MVTEDVILEDEKEKSYKSFREWVYNYEESFKEVEFCIPGHTEKWFHCFVKISIDKKYWTIIYQNPDNSNDWWIRNETVSQLLWYYGKPIRPVTFTHLFNKLVNKYEQQV